MSSALETLSEATGGNSIVKVIESTHKLFTEKDNQDNKEDDVQKKEPGSQALVFMTDRERKQAYHKNGSLLFNFDDSKFILLPLHYHRTNLNLS